MSIEIVIRMIAVVGVSFLLGSIPSSVMIGKIFYGIDPRDGGSGATGATNSLRTMGKRAGLFVALSDIGKGWLSIVVCKYLLAPASAVGDPSAYFALGVALIFVVAGHAFSPWIGFKGGKGVAVAAGATIGLYLPLFLVELIGIVAISLISGYVSLGSMCVAAVLPLWMLIFPNLRHIELIAPTVVGVVLVIWLHRENIARLKSGTENKLSFKKKETPRGDEVETVEIDTKE